jgi:hypothetical protein
LALNATFLMVTNGLHHIYCQIDYDKQAYHFMPDFPLKGLAL